MLPLALSTHWNAFRHTSAEALVDEIRSLGFEAVELGYDLTADLAVDLPRLVERGAVRVVSVHNFCPVPAGAPRGHPELFHLADPVAKARDSAVQLTLNTIRFAAEVGAHAVVVHCGNVSLRPRTTDLIAMAEAGRRHSERYEKIRLKMLVRRDKRAGRYLDALQRSLEALLPELEAARVRLCIENLPSWESIPTEQEMERLLDGFDSPWIRAWHDIGHGRIRENLGFINHLHWFRRLGGRLAGMHLHDVAPPARDHLMPPAGEIDYRSFQSGVRADTVRVLEPAPGTPAEELVAGSKHIAAALSAGEGRS